MKAKIVYNPIAGRGKSGHVIGRLTKLLACNGWDFETAHCNKDLPLNTDNIDVIMVVGGDGTINDVVNALPKNAPPLVLVPTGTSNVFARDLNVSRNLRQMVKVATGPENKYIDLGIEKKSGRRFVSMLGAGFDAQVVHKLHLRRKGKINQFIYVVYSIEELPNYEASKIRVEVDGKQVERSANFVVVSNTSCYGGPILFTPSAKLNDGLLDVFIYKGGYKMDIVRLWGFAFLSYLTRGFVCHFTSQALQGKRIQLFSDEKIPVQVDGEYAGFTPADIEILPKELLVKA